MRCAPKVPWSTIALTALALVAVSGSASAQTSPESPPVATPAAVPPPPSGRASAAVPQVAPAPSPVPAPSPSELRHRRVTVEIDSTRPSTVLERRVSLTDSEGAYFFLPYRASSSIWEDVCVTPCQVDLDRFSTYKVSARNGISASRAFTLPQQGDELSLKVDAGNLTAHRFGAALTGAGIAAFIVGVALIAGEGIFTNEDKARNAGFITGGAGLVALAVGIPLTLFTGTTVAGPAGKVAATSRTLAF